MKNATLYLPGFHLATLRRKPRSASQKLADQFAEIRRKSISQLAACFAHFIPDQILKPHRSGAQSRRRLFSKENTFWGFFTQVLNADSGCSEVVRKFHAFAASRSMAQPSSSTSGYCQARQKFNESDLKSILAHTRQQLAQRPTEKSLQGRRVIVADGTGVSMPDSAKNQRAWPQTTQQKPGCGFPQAYLCACFDLQTGALVSDELGNKKSHELLQLRAQRDSFETGDIFLGDKGFCSYYDVSRFLDQGVDSVVTLARRQPVTAANADQILGEDDLLIHWPKPKWRAQLSYSKAEWEALPEKLVLRQIKVHVQEPGYRSRSLFIITTLTDTGLYSAPDVAGLYRQRWDVLAEQACRFIEKLPHTKGKWAAQKLNLVLAPWQKFIVCNLFGWVNATGLRRFRKAYLKIPRKNGKSLLVAAIGHYLFARDGEYGAEVYSGATTEKQAWEVFGPAGSGYWYRR